MIDQQHDKALRLICATNGIPNDPWVLCLVTSASTHLGVLLVIDCGGRVFGDVSCGSKELGDGSGLDLELHTTVTGRQTGQATSHGCH